MLRRIASASIGLLVVALLGSVLVQVWAVPSMVDQVVLTFPEVRPIAVPAIVWGVVATLCWQVAAIIGIRLLVLVRTGEFGASANGWLRAVIACLTVYVILVVIAWITLSVLGWATPGVMLGLFVSAVVALVAVISLLLFLRTKSNLGHLLHT